VTSTLVKLAPIRKSIAGKADGAPNPTAVLAIILACYLMIVLDVSVIIAALPKIHRALDFSPTSLSWVQNAYTLTFGGLLLLGARAGDILGRRRMLVTGIALFTFASLLGGLAPSAEWLLGARALQGIGAAIAAPSTLALLTTTFREGQARTRAIAYYSAVAGGGGSVGLVLGGVLTDWLSWRWGLFINVPIGLAVIVLAPRYLPETERRSGRFDLTGAVTSTLGMTALVYGFVRAASDGWGDRGTVASFAAGVVLLAAFGLTERRAEQPITPLHLFASRQRSGAYAARVLVTGGMFSTFFFLTQFLQGVSGYSALEAGLAFLPMTAVMFGMGRLVPLLTPRVGSSRLLKGGLFLAVIGIAWLSRISDATHYFPGIAVPLALLGIGIGIAFTPLTAAGIAGVAQHDAGAASGLLNVAQQLGGSLGLGILITVFASATRSAAEHPLAGVSAHIEARHELAHAVATSLTGSAVLLTLALAVAVIVMRRPAVAGEARSRWSFATLRTNPES
jgi:EmrB/QacA subfamily drug resistance transporter